MPWRGPQYRGDFPSLGYQVSDWIQDRCAIPDGVHQGEPYVLTEEMLTFLVWHYRLHVEAEPQSDKPSAAFTYRRSQLIRPQKWGKGPLAAAMVCAEAAGPVLFAGWDDEGEPVGRPWATPHIQITAVSEDQTDNVWRALQPMIELGAIAGDIPDTGLTRINLPGGGLIEPVTASARSRLGQRITFVVQDETHSWLKQNGGQKLADTQRRNLAGMGGRSVETTNAWDPSEQSVAQLTYESKAQDIHRDYPIPPSGSFTAKRDRRRILKSGYGGSWWVDLDRIDAEAVDIMSHDPAQAERFFGNRIVTGSDAAFDLERWHALKVGVDIPKGKNELIVLGFDGARFHDSTGLIATHVESGLQWVQGLWEDDGSEGWEVSQTLVDEAIEGAFDEWEVWRLYGDPPYWETPMDQWAGKYGEKRVIRWWTNRSKAMCYSLRNYVSGQSAGEVGHLGAPDFDRHIGNARKRVHPQIRDEKGLAMWDITKDRPESPNKIDLAMAGCLSWEARGDALAAGAKVKKRRAAVFL